MDRLRSKKSILVYSWGRIRNTWVLSDCIYKKDNFPEPKSREDSMIFLFDVHPFASSGQGLGDIDRVKFRLWTSEALKKIGKSWHGVMKQIWVKWETSDPWSYCAV